MARRIPKPRHAAKSPSNARWQDAHARALSALAEMRKGVSLSAACRLEHIKPSTFRRHVGTAVHQDKPNGRFRARTTDHLQRTLQVPTAQGPVTVSVRGLKAARTLSAYANAVAHFNRTGDVSKLQPFKGKTFLVAGRPTPFVTDADTLTELALADALRLDSLYAAFSGPR